MNYSKHFLESLANTLYIEGGYSFDPKDFGGETFKGISRVYWPNWAGWKKIDQWKGDGGDLPDMAGELKEFYHTNFWCRFQGDKIAQVCPDVAEELFDTAVNVGVGDAVKFFQTALNIQNYEQKFFKDILVDGKFGRITLGVFTTYMNSRPGSYDTNKDILLRCMNGEQYIHYKAFSQHEYFRGIFLRT